jgi:hypothetical protein
MTYPIRKTDGSLLLDLAPGITNTTITSLALIGKNSAEFGLNQNQNFVRLLENSANSFQPSPSLTGQLWFDTTLQQMKVKTATGFVSIGPFPTPTTPAIDNKSTSYATTEFVHSILPKGTIVMWYGALDTIPSGWTLCDGHTANGIQTPDLTKRFVMGAGASLSGQAADPNGYTYYQPGDMGGATAINTVVAHSHPIDITSTNNSVSHTHGGTTNSAGVHQHGYPGDDQLSFANGRGGWTASSLGGFNYDARSVGGGGGQVWQTTGNGSHNHTLNLGTESASHTHEVAGNTSSVGSASVNVTNPYYALAYIMKTI